MPTDGPRQITDFVANEIDDGVGLDLGAAGAFLRGLNLVRNANLERIRPDGSPDGMRMFSGPVDEGFIIYSTKAGGTSAETFRYSTEPIDAETDVVQMLRPVVESAGPMTRGDEDAFPLRNTLDAPVLRAVKSETVGFPPGKYLLAITAGGAGGTETEPTQFVEFEIVDEPGTTGKSIQGVPLQDPPEGTEFQGIYLTQPAGFDANGIPNEPDQNTARRQAWIKSGRRSFVLDGPYDYGGRKPPRRNETMVGNAKRPRYREDYRLRGHSNHDFQGFENLQVYFVEATANGRGLPSVPSRARDFKRAKDHEIEFSPDRRDWHPRTTGFLVYITYDEGNTFYRIIQPRRKRTEPFGLNHRPSLWGPATEADLAAANLRVPSAEQAARDALNESRGGGDAPDDKVENGDDPQEKEKKTKPPRRQSHILIQEDPNFEEDTSGIENPSGAPDPPVAIGRSRPGPGRYLIRYAKRYDGKITPASPYASISIKADEVIEVLFPPKVNRIPNAIFRIVGKDDRPARWTWGLANSTMDLRDGVPYLKTNGIIVANGVGPSGLSEPLEIYPERIETFRGILGLVGYGGQPGTAGVGRAEIVQYSDNAGTVEIANSRIVLSTISQNGQVSLDRKIGPAELGGEVQYNELTERIRFIYYLTGANRNATVYVHSLALHPFDAKPRRFIFPPTGIAEPLVSTTESDVPYPSRNVVGVATATPAPTDAVSGPPPHEITDWEGTLGATEPPGYDFVRSVANTNTECQVIADPSIQGARLLRVRSDHTNSKNNIWAVRDYDEVPPENGEIGNSYGERMRLKLTRIITRGQDSSTVYQFSDQNGRVLCMARVKNTANNGSTNSPRAQVQFQSATKSGNLGSLGAVVSGLLPNTIQDIEMLVGGLGTSQGTATIIVTTNTGSRATVTHTGRDFRGSRLRYVYKGSWSESDARDRVTYDFDDIWATPNGYGGATSPPPPLEDIVLTDRPSRAGEVLFQSTTDLDEVETMSPVENLAVRGSYTASGVDVGDTPVLRVTNAGATSEAVSCVRRATTGAVDAIIGGTVYPVLASTPNGNWSLEAVISGAGSSSASVLVYFRQGTGGRRLRVLATNVDLTGIEAQRGIVTGGTNFAATEILITERGSTEFIDRFDDGSVNGGDVYQGYTSVVPLDATDGRIGLEVDEFFVRPGARHTGFVWIAWEDFNVEENPAPFVPVLYDQTGENPIELQSLLGPTGATTRASDWVDARFDFVPPAGYYRLRFENRNIFNGSFRWQLPGVGRGLLDTQEARDAVRNEQRVLRGSLRQTLSARIPGASMYSESFEERWVYLGVPGESPVAEDENIRAAVADNVLNTFEVGGNPWATGALLRLEGTALPAGIPEDNLLYVRDVSGDTFAVSTTPDGPALDFGVGGSNLTFRGATLIVAKYRTTNDPEPLVWTPAEPTTDRSLLLEHAAWIDVHVEMYGDGFLTPHVPAGSWLVYRTLQPMLVREDRSPLPGGVIVGKHRRPVTHPDYRQDSPGGRSKPVPITDELGRFKGFTAGTFNPLAEVEVGSDLLRHPWYVEDWTFNMIAKIVPYEMAEIEGFETDLFESATGYLPATFPVGKAEVIENGFFVAPEVEA